MAKTTFKCPVCGKPLAQAEYERALGLWEAKEEHIQHLEAEQHKLQEQQEKVRQKLLDERKKLRAREARLRQQAAQLAQNFKKERSKLIVDKKRALREQAQKAKELLRRQRTEIEKSLSRKMKVQIREGVEKGVAEQKGRIKKQEAQLRKTRNKMLQLERSLQLSAGKYERANDEIKRLKEQIEKGITPQIEGLLEEDKLLVKLVELFPRDRFEHPGKGGDIIQSVVEQGKEIGKIVYECKKVKHFDRKHIEQAKEARRQRHADFAILVTNAFPAKKQYYFVEKTVFVISPVSLEPITQTLRDSLVRIALLKVSNEAKTKAVQQVYDYLSGTEYSNKMNDVAAQLLDLGKELKGEVVAHRRIWEKRYRVYQTLFNDVNALDYRLRSLVHNLPGSKQRLLPEPQKVYIEINEIKP
jgi:hypothetical protein